MPRSKKAQKQTLINYIIDESGSMAGIQGQVITGFNEYISELRKNVDGKVFVTLTTFSTGEKSPFTFKPLDEVEDLTYSTYVPAGMTALYDAIANTVKRVESDVTDNTQVITVIMTDGQENSSRENTEEQVNALITQKQDAGNWTFVFLGADQDAWATASRLGVARGNVISYASHTHGHTMRNLTSATASSISGQSMSTGTYFADAGQSQEDYDKLADIEPIITTPTGSTSPVSGVVKVKQDTNTNSS